MKIYRDRQGKVNNFPYQAPPNYNYNTVDQNYAINENIPDEGLNNYEGTTKTGLCNIWCGTATIIFLICIAIIIFLIVKSVNNGQSIHYHSF